MFLILISNVDTFKFEDQCLITQMRRSFLQCERITGYWWGIKTDLQHTNPDFRINNLNAPSLYILFVYLSSNLCSDCRALRADVMSIKATVTEVELDPSRSSRRGSTRTLCTGPYLDKIVVKVYKTRHLQLFNCEHFLFINIVKQKQ